MMVKRKANLDDGCNPELVAGAVFEAGESDWNR